MNKSNIYKRYRSPSEIIQYAVWLYYRFTLSHRDIEDLLAERGINVSYESIRLWCNRLGPKIATKAHLNDADSRTARHHGERLFMPDSRLMQCKMSVHFGRLANRPFTTHCCRSALSLAPHSSTWQRTSSDTPTRRGMEISGSQEYAIGKDTTGSPVTMFAP
jgi:hypothetical protein